MSDDTDTTPAALPSTIPPPKETPTEQALMRAFLRLDGKLDKVLEMLGSLTLLTEDVRAGQTAIEDRVSAIEAIPHTTTILPPPNGELDG